MGKGSKERLAWRNMIKRCCDPKSREWKHYGAKGITVCPEWINSFERFMEDVGPAPNLKRSTWLGRQDVTKGYAPGNVEWTSQAVQENRRAYCRHVTVFGKRMTAAQASRLPGQPNRSTVVRREERGTPHETPVKVPPQRLILLEYNGKKLSIDQVARSLGITRKAVLYRLHAGWAIERVVSVTKR